MADKASDAPLTASNTSADCTPPVNESQGPETRRTEQHGAGFWGLALGSVGVVFGDIGTSPLYAFKEALGEAAGDGILRSEILGVVSLMLWALILIVTVKYVLFLMRADNNGEGGVLSLMALAQRALGKRTMMVFGLGVVGAALFYGDAIITPAISVLSAVEGLKTIPSLSHAVDARTVMTVSVVILIVLFMVQARGTAKVAAFFGPITVLWFLVMGGLGLSHLLAQPSILWALSPHMGVAFLMDHGFTAFLVLGAVFLTVTGAEALYADMGHFGRWPIQSAWLYFCLPCLMLNYLGQGAMALHELHASVAAGRPFNNMNWFFEMASPMWRPGLVVLAGAATVIASQAVITGAYSLTQQAVQLGLLPRIDIRRTSETQAGQIYVPQINTFLMIGVLIVVVAASMVAHGDEGGSSVLAHAYGLAVTGTMVVTTCLAFVVIRHQWKWSLPVAVVFISPALALDLTFLASNALKIPDGGWFPLTMALVLFVVMWTWTRGSQILSDKTRRDSVPLSDLAEIMRARAPHRAAGTAIFLTSDPDMTPVALMHNLKHNKVLHEKNVILTVRTAETPRVADEDRVKIAPVNDDFRKIYVSYGFMESPNLPKALQQCRKQGLKFDIMATSFFLGRRTIVPSANSGMPLWQDKLFIFLMKNATNPTDFFKIPYGRVVELGAQVTV